MNCVLCGPAKAGVNDGWSKINLPIIVVFMIFGCGAVCVFIYFYLLGRFF